MQKVVPVKHPFTLFDLDRFKPTQQLIVKTSHKRPDKNHIPGDSN